MTEKKRRVRKSKRDLGNGLWLCGKCGLSKMKSDFYVQRTGLPRRECKECWSSVSSERWLGRTEEEIKRRADTVARYNLKRYYGMTLEQFQTMEHQQRGCCAICGREGNHSPRAQRRRLAVDHCHSTGKIRALLCNRCNTMLGQANDDVGYLKSLIDYLENWHDRCGR